jgi:cell division protein FtsA
MGEILEPRIEEMLVLINQEMIDSSYKERINAGVVISGGTALLHNLVELAEQIFDLPVRIGYPQNIATLPASIDNPQYATGVGLVLYSSKNSPGPKFRLRNKKIVGSFTNWCKNLLRSNL